MPWRIPGTRLFCIPSLVSLSSTWSSPGPDCRNEACPGGPFLAQHALVLSDPASPRLKTLGASGPEEPPVTGEWITFKQVHPLRCDPALNGGSD